MNHTNRANDFYFTMRRCSTQRLRYILKVYTKRCTLKHLIKKKKEMNERKIKR